MTSPTPDLFAHAAAMTARDRAIDGEEHSAEASDIAMARRIVMRTARTLPSFTTDDVIAFIPAARDLFKTEPRACGAVMRSLVASGQIVATGEYRTGGNRVCHNRAKRVWRLA